MHAKEIVLFGFSIIFLFVMIAELIDNRYRPKDFFTHIVLMVILAYLFYGNSI